MFLVFADEKHKYRDYENVRVAPVQETKSCTVEFTATEAELSKLFSYIKNTTFKNNCFVLYKRLSQRIKNIGHTLNTEHLKLAIDKAIEEWKKEHHYVTGLSEVDFSYEIVSSGSQGFVIVPDQNLLNMTYGYLNLDYFALSPKPEDGSEPHYPYLISQLKKAQECMANFDESIKTAKHRPSVPECTYWVEVKESHLHSHVFSPATERVKDTVRFGFNDKSQAIDLFNSFRKKKIPVGKNWID